MFANFTDLINGIYYFNASAYDSAGNVNWTATWNVSVFINQAPQVIFVSNISNVDPIEAGTTAVNFDTTVYDANGFTDINFSSISANFTRNGAARLIDNCSNTANYSAYYANLTCTITMWYFDSPGMWNVSVGINDNANAFGTNTSTYFQLNQLQAIVIYPQQIDFGSLTTNSYNSTANSPISINNTGNANLTEKIAVNAINLGGETFAENYLDVKNISTSAISGGSCAGNALQNSSDIIINGFVLEAGNLSAGQAQANSYYCLKSAKGLPTQIYSTKNLGGWTIKVI